MGNPGKWHPNGMPEHMKHIAIAQRPEYNTPRQHAALEHQRKLDYDRQMEQQRQQSRNLQQGIASDPQSAGYWQQNSHSQDNRHSGSSSRQANLAQSQRDLFDYSQHSHFGSTSALSQAYLDEIDIYHQRAFSTERYGSPFQAYVARTGSSAACWHFDLEEDEFSISSDYLNSGNTCGNEIKAVLDSGA